MISNKVITFGTFDLFHIGHKNILERAKEYGDKLYDLLLLETAKFFCMENM